MRRCGRLSALLALEVYVLLGAWATALAVSDHAGHAGHTGHTELPAAAYSARSIYQVESVWTTAAEQALRLGHLQGKVQVLAMVYTTCESSCPIIVSLMQHLEAALPPELRSHVGFVLVTLDPERDTPSSLRAYSDKMHLDSASWSLLSGHPDDVMELAMLLGIRYKRDQGGGFIHSNVMTVFNKAGEIVHRHEGLQQDMASTLEAIRRAAQH
jgi:protein SCO1/2